MNPENEAQRERFLAAFAQLSEAEQQAVYAWTLRRLRAYQMAADHARQGGYRRDGDPAPEGGSR
jgi:hypothetical protein